MKKILFTGFDPFGGETDNPSIMAVKSLPMQIDGVQIIKAEIPTVFGKSIGRLRDILEEEKPCALICVGQAGGRASITLERIAINCEDTFMPDNEGNKPSNQKIVKDGPDAYFVTLPIVTMLKDLIEAGIPVSISNSAGTFVCNHLIYGALHYAFTNKIPLQAGFVHIPYIPRQSVNRPNVPSMALELVVEGLALMVKTLIHSPAFTEQKR